MAPVPREVRLEQLIKELDGEIFREQGRLVELVLQKPSQRGTGGLIHEFKRYFDLSTRRHALELERTYPGATILYQPKLVEVRTADGESKRPPALRIPDNAIAARGELHLGEVKTEQSIIDAVSKAGGDQRVLAQFLPSSKLGGQLATEKRVLRWGLKNGVAWWVEWQDPVTLAHHEGAFPVEKVHGSRVQSYLNMGDGIELGLQPKAPPLPEPAKVPLPVDPRALERKGFVVDSRALGERLQSYGRDPHGPYRGGSTPIDPRGVMARHRGLTSSVEGVGVMILQQQFSYMNNAALEKMYAALDRRGPAIDRERREGNWVRVTVQFAEPKSPDVFGLAGDSYLIFHWLSFDSAPDKLVTDPKPAHSIWTATAPFWRSRRAC